MKRTISRFALLVVIALSLKATAGRLWDLQRVDGDASQHVFWTAKFADPELFPNDALVDFISSPRFDPPGYQAVYFIGAHLMSPLRWSAVVGLGLCLVTGLCAYWWGQRKGGELVGLLCVVAVAAVSFDVVRSGLPRSFATPLLMSFLLCLDKRQIALCGLIILAASLLYPPAVLSLGLMLPLLVVNGRHIQFEAVPEVAARLAIPLLLAIGVLSFSYLMSDRELTGSMVTRAESQAMPEFGPNGRNRFWLENPVAFWLGNFRYNRSSCGLFSQRVLFPVIALLLLLVIQRRRLKLPRGLKWMLLSSLLLFFVAHAVLFSLYLPSRYTIYTGPLCLALLVGLNFGERWRRRSPAAEAWLAGSKAQIVGWLLIIGIVGATALIGKKGIADDTQALHRLIASLPKTIMIAGLPKVLDEVPLRTNRSVLINRELSLAWYQGYYARAKQRIEDSLVILLAGREDDVHSAASRNGVTHILLPLPLIEQGSADLGLRPPHDAFARNLLAQSKKPFWMRFRAGELQSDQLRLIGEGREWALYEVVQRP